MQGEGAACLSPTPGPPFRPAPVSRALAASMAGALRSAAAASAALAPITSPR